jgi:hypothetical protein
LRIFKNKPFTRFARKKGIPDEALCAAIDDAEGGLIDARLGSGVIQQRVARPGAGKSGGFRTIILYKTRARAFFVYGFAKQDRDNIEDDELAAFKALAREMLAYDDARIARAMALGILIEVKRDD